MKVQELERENGQMEYELQKVRGQLEKETGRNRKLEK